jgi:hypothetical protein
MPAHICVQRKNEPLLGSGSDRHSGVPATALFILQGEGTGGYHVPSADRYFWLAANRGHRILDFELLSLLKVKKLLS